MTIREHLARAFPLHFQRINEAMVEQHGKYAELMLDSTPWTDKEPPLAMAFVFLRTIEGHDYWSALAYRSQV